MPCENCNVQFTIFKRKQPCTECQRFYCPNCLKKSNKGKKVCEKCLVFLQKPFPAKEAIMAMKTKDLVFYLQWKKISLPAGAVEKEDLANLIINHANHSYYESGTTNSHSSTSTPNDFEFQSFDQIKQTCQNLFTSISDKIASDFQKTTCFNNSSTQQNRAPTTQQPRRSSIPRSYPASPQTPTASEPHFRHEETTSANIPNSSTAHQREYLHNCDCSEDEIDEISEKRQSIFASVDGNPGPSGCSRSLQKTKVANSSSSDSSSFEEVEPKLIDEKWEVIEKTASNGIRTLGTKLADEQSFDAKDVVCSDPNYNSIEASVNPEIRKLTRRRSDSSLLSLKKSSSIFLDTSAFDPTQSCGSEVKKVKISCNKCGKAKSNIKLEILKLSEQLLSSNKSEAEVNAKIKEFLDYLESKSQPSEMTETEGSRSNQNNENLDQAQFLPTSSSHDEIEENIFDENEGINVYPSSNDEYHPSFTEQSTARRFISLNDIQSNDDLESLSVKQLKEILALNRVDFKGCCEKKELKERVQRLWQSHMMAPPSEKLPTDELCKICMDAPIECVFLECGHSCTCVTCGKVLNECPLCRSYVVRVVRIFKS